MHIVHPSFGSEVFQIQPQYRFTHHPQAHRIGHITGKGFDHHIGNRHFLHQVGHKRIAPLQHSNALVTRMTRRHICCGQQRLQGLHIVYPQHHLQALLLLQLPSQAPRHAYVTKIVYHAAKQPHCVCFRIHPLIMPESTAMPPIRYVVVLQAACAIYGVFMPIKPCP